MNPRPPKMDAEFKKKRAQWLRCLGSTAGTKGAKADRNAIVIQVQDMVWSSAVFGVVLKAREIANTDSDGNLQMSGLIHRRLDRWFYESQIAAIRRVLDPSKRASISGRNAVSALLPLLADMKQNRQLFTRKNLCAASSTCLDADAVRKADLDGRRAGREGGMGILDSRVTDDTHKMIDRLCNVTSGKRSPKDSVVASVFRKLERLLDRANPLHRHATKFVAHAATRLSRSQVEKLKVTLNDIWAAQESICQACQFIEICLLHGFSRPSFLAMAAGDKFKHIDKPLVLPGRVQQLGDAWNDFEQETERWMEDVLERVIGGQNRRPPSPPTGTSPPTS